MVERLVGHPVFRVDVSHRIDEGRSWQLGLLLAHRLAASGRLAQGDLAQGDLAQGDLAPITVWATGEVSHAMAVLPVDHVDRKIRRSVDVLARRVAAGDRVVVVMPSANARALDVGLLPDGVELFGVDRAEEAFAAIERQGSTGLPSPRRPSSGRRRPLAWVVLLAVTAIALAGWGLSVALKGSSLSVDIPSWTTVPPMIASPTTVPQASLADVSPPRPETSLDKASAVAPAPDGAEVPAPDGAGPPLPRRRPEVPSSEGAIPGGGSSVAIVGRTADGAACGADEETGPEGRVLSLPRACRVMATFTNQGDAPVDTVLELRLEGGFADYVRADRYRAEARDRVEPGRSMSVSVSPPNWVRRGFVARAVGSADGRVEKIERRVDLR